LTRKIPPNRIAYVSFTQKAAHEARGRAVDRFDYAAEEFEYFRTLHSLSARVMGLKNDEFMHAENYKEIGDRIGLAGLTGKKISWKTSESRSVNYGNHLLNLIDVARNMKLPLTEYMASLPADAVNYSLGRNGKAFKVLAAELHEYKKAFGLRDFTDLMIEPVTLEYPPLDVDVAIIDEAQDLTATQWDFVDRMFSSVKELYIAGDDDQAIYQWNGADVKRFLRLEGERRVLAKSWRLPRRPWMLANWITGKISERYAKDWTHRDGEGVVKSVDTFSAAPILEGGDWMVLGRNNAFLKDVQQWLINKGVPIKRSDYDIIDTSDMRAIHAWAALSQGKDISGAGAKLLYDTLVTKKHVAYGAKVRLSDVADDATLCHDTLRDDFGLMADVAANWWETLLKIPEKKRAYYRRVRQHGESLRNPRVTLSTIHGVKGGEADNVLLLPDMARQTHKIFSCGKEYHDEEHRVFYVGASRTKENLYICGQQGPHRYPFPPFKERTTC
jgi:DNA helicase-2/ATP-dependent DNA helicase PcrA